MALMIWNESLMLGLPSIDQQHQKLVGLINSLHDAMIARQGHQALGKILDALVDYTHTHFAYEEELFVKHGYRGMAVHVGAHRQLTTKVLEFREQFRNGRIAMSASVLEFLQEWLTKHICETDAQYVRHLRAKGVR
jgi:hemerythrin